MNPLFPNEPFLSDNPFRLLELPPTTPIPTVRRKADQVSRQLAAGIGAIIHDDDFGDENLKDITTITRALLKDSQRRMIYRILWSAPLKHQWSGFLVHPDQQQLLSASLSSIASLNDNPKHTEPLVTLLASEDEISREEAQQVIRQALDSLAEHLVSRAVQIAVEQGENGNLANLVGITKSILGSPLDDQLEERGLTAITKFGDRFLEKITNDTETDDSNFNEEMLAPITQLILIIGNRHPCTSRWDENLEKIRNIPITNLRSKAIELANQNGDYSGAIKLLQKALSITKCNSTREKLQDDIQKCNYHHVVQLRNQAIDAANSRDDYKTALLLTKEALQIVDDPEQDKRLSEDIQTLNRLIQQVKTERVASLKKKISWGVGLVAGLIVLVNIFNSPETHISPTATPTPFVQPLSASSSSSTFSSSDLTGSSSTTATKNSHSDQTPLRFVSTPSASDLRQKLLIKHDELKLIIKSKDSELEIARNEIESKRSDLESEANSLDSRRRTLDRTSQSEVDEFNLSLDIYRSNQKNFNEIVNSYNSDIQRQKARIQEFNSLVEKINAMR